MAFNAGTVKGTLDLKIQRFKKSVRTATRGLKGLGRAAKSAGRAITGFGSGFKGVAIRMAAAVAGVLAIRAAMRKLTSTLADASAKQRVYEQSVRRLAASLISQGAPAVAAVTKELENYATVIQDTTAFGDVDVLNTAQSLVAFGAAEDKLKQYTKAVLDTASALNLDAKTAARAFGQALAGNAATLGRYIPALRGMTQEQLKAGAAFDKAAEAFGGFSEIAAQSTEGALTQLGNAADDLRKRLGAAFNEFLGPLAQDLTRIFRELVNNLGEGSTGFQALVETMRSGFEVMLAGVRLLIEGFYRSRVAVRSLMLAGAWLQQAMVAVVTGIVEGFAKVTAAIAKVAVGVAEFVATIPGLSESIKESVSGVADYFREVEKNARKVDDEMDRLQEAAADIVKERKKAVLEAQRELMTIQTGVESENALLNAVTKVYHLKVRESSLQNDIREQREQEAADTIRLQRLAGEYNQRLKERLEHLRAVRSEMGAAAQGAESTRAATEGIANAAGNAANRAGEMANAFGQAANSASAAASAAASIGGGAGTRAGESRRAGGSTTLDFSDPFRAVALAQQAQERLRRTHPSAFAGRTQVNAASAYARDVGAAAAAAVRQSHSDFAASIISELNQAGIMDPAERSRIVRERISEAERMNVIPSAARLERINAGVLR